MLRLEFTMSVDELEGFLRMSHPYQSLPLRKRKEKRFVMVGRIVVVTNSTNPEMETTYVLYGARYPDV